MKIHKKKLVLCGLLLVFAIKLIALNITCEKYFFYAPQPIHNFGEIPVEHGLALGRHVFEVRNLSEKDIEIEKIVQSCSCVKTGSLSVVKSRKNNALVVEMFLPQEHYAEREVEIVLIPKDAKIEPLRLKLIGRAAHKPFFVPASISLDRFSLKETGKGMTTLYYPSNKPLNKIIARVESKEKEMLVQAFPIIAVKRNTQEGDSAFYLHQIRIELTYPYTKERLPGDGNSSINVFLVDGTKYCLPVEWYCYQKGAFNVERYLVTDDTCLFQIIFNNDVVGNIKDYTIRGNGLKIDKIEKFETFSVFTIACQKNSKQTNQQKGELVVVTQDGLQYILPIDKF